MADNTFKNGSFFGVVNRLERVHNPSAKVGELGPASLELFRFKSNPSLAFSGRDIAEVERLGPTDEGRPRYAIVANFLGLSGASSPLPTFYSEDVLQNDTLDEAKQKFVDFFHHRFLSLVYRAGLKYRYLFRFQPDCADPMSERLLAAAGFGPAGATDTAGVHKKLLLRYAGLLYHRPRSATALQSALSDFLSGIPVKVRQFQTSWTEIPLAQQSRLGRANMLLGQGIIAGARVKTCTSSFRIVIGPQAYGDFIRFLPCRPGFTLLVSMVRLFLTDPFDFDIELRVLVDSIPPMITAKQPPPKLAARLGWTSWLNTPKVGEDPTSKWRSVVFQSTRGRKAG